MVPLDYGQLLFRLTKNHPQTQLSGVVALLLNTAQLELVLKDMFKSLLEKKEEKWTSSKI